MANIIEKIIGTYSDRELKRIYPIVDKIEALEPEIQKLSDKELRAKTDEFKERLNNGETLDDILPEAYAVVREAGWRVNGMRAFRCQLVGGVVLHQGRIAEMKTGEGKTLVAVLPVYLNALTGKGVHVVTVNDYLARRDSEWMGKIYTFLGLSVGLIVHDLDNEERRDAYNCDITYGTNNEFGFDYLRDNMVIYKEECVQRELNFAIVDEVDSILIDEARTPLIISGEGDKSTDIYKRANTFVSGLSAKVFTETDDKEEMGDIDADYIVDEKASTATLTDRGVKKAEKFFGIDNLSDPDNLTISHHINQALRAHGLMKNERDYVVKDGEVIIVDEFTGRLMYGRRYSDGLHQAIESKEGVTVERESKTLATITFQNYFRMYNKLSGMTGTALTEETEFQTIYKLDVIVIPTNKPMIRNDLADSVYKTEEGKFKAVVEQILECHEKGQPVLVGTITIEKSELLSKILKRRGIQHQVLNAKYHDKEAEIIAQAGKLGAVTIATNMAGRGTDIMLGGNAEHMAKQDMRKQGIEEELINQSTSFNETTDEEILNARKIYNELYEKHKAKTDAEREKVVEAGGLFILGTERHESRRIDNQLRGRAGRQGDPGASRFFISLEDDLMRLFGSERLQTIVATLGLEEDQAIEHRMLTNAIENAQKKVEGRNFDIRKHVIQYDDVMNKQREIVYAQRRQVLDGEDLKDSYMSMIHDYVSDTVDAFCQSPHVDDWDFEALNRELEFEFNFERKPVDPKDLNLVRRETVIDEVVEKATEKYEKKEERYGSEFMREFERIVLLRTVDEKWMEHIDSMDQLRNEIGLRAYGQHNPIEEYSFEGFDMFEAMMRALREDALKIIFNARIEAQPVLKRERVAEPTSEGLGDDGVKKPKKRTSKKVGRNDPCPCGSGKKYKYCCGKDA